MNQKNMKTLRRLAGNRAFSLVRLTTAVALISTAAAMADQSPSCTESDTLSRRVEFADLGRASHLLGHPDAWARQLSVFDIGIRLRTTQPTSLQDFLAFTADAGTGWAAQEQAALRPLVDELSNAMSGLNLHVPNVELVQTTGQHEFMFAYTRERAIMLPQRFIPYVMTNPRGAYFLLAHEMFHILSRADPRLRDDLFALLGFRMVRRFEYPVELEERRFSNPDAFEYQHSVTVQTASGSADVLPILQSLLPLEEAILLPNFVRSDALDIVLLSVDDTGQVLRDGNGNLITYNFGNTNWVPLMQRNTSYIIDPEEALADNFATLMEWRSTGVLPVDNPAGDPINDVNLLVAIQEVLASGCRN
jgi:hypothetical protein